MINAKLAAKLAQLSADRVPFVLATVVRARRPTSVKPGDNAIVLSDGTIDGFVGGQCAESSVRLYSLRALETGEPMLLRLIPGAEGEPLPDGIDGVIVERNPCMSGGAIEIFVEPQLPMPRIMIFGGSPVARALEALAGAGNYEVVPTLEFDEAELGSATAVVVASHGNDEERVLTAALSAGVPYVALVASEKRGAAVREALDLAPELAAQLHTPAGVDIGAVTPAEIAISILAELVVVLHADPTAEPPVDRDHDHEKEGEGEATEEEEAQSEPAAELTAARNAHNGAAYAPGRVANGSARTVATGAEPPVAASLPARFDKDITRKLPAVDPLRALASETVGRASDGESDAEPGIDYAIDPVCGMKVAVSESTLHLDVGGQRAYFCGTGCRVAYAAPASPDAAKV